MGMELLLCESFTRFGEMFRIFFDKFTQWLHGIVFSTDFDMEVCNYTVTVV